MKQAFNKNWGHSSQARKQRKFRANAPLHIKSKFLHASLSKELRKTHGRRTVRVRAGDEVEVMRGSYKGVKGEVDGVQTRNLRVFVRGAEVAKPDGGRRQIPIAVSNVRITKLVEEKRRMKSSEKSS